MGILDALVRRPPTEVEQRYSWNDYVMSFAGNQYALTGMTGSRPDMPDGTFEDHINKVHRQNGVVSAAVTARALLLSQLRFAWMRSSGENKGEMFETRALYPLTRGVEPRPMFLHRLEIDVSYAGSAYVVRDNRSARRLRPDRCSVVLGSNSDPTWDADDGTMRVPYDAEVVALLYQESALPGSKKTLFWPGEFTIWAPEPDPINFWRGTSWVSSVLREVTVDNQSIDHQGKFFENAATPNLVFLMDPGKTPEETNEFAALTNRLHAGTGGAFKNMFLGGGTDVKMVGSTLESLNLKDLTGGMETRVALRSRVPGVILGVREGYAGSSLNQGNYNSARRMFADGWLAPTADSMCAALTQVVNVPDNAELHCDRSQVLFLQEDQQQQADILSTKTSAIRTLIDGGFDPESVTTAVAGGDLTKLVHTGNLSVQLQPAEMIGEDDDPAVGDDDDES